jgi:hypothetical protein
VLLSELLGAHPNEQPEVGFRVHWQERSLRVSAILDRTCVVDDPEATPTPKRLLRLDAVEVDPSQPLVWHGNRKAPTGPVVVSSRAFESASGGIGVRQEKAPECSEEVVLMSASTSTEDPHPCERCQRPVRSPVYRLCYNCRAICDCGAPKDYKAEMCLDCRRALRQGRQRPISAVTTSGEDRKESPAYDDLLRRLDTLEARMRQWADATGDQVRQVEDRLYELYREAEERRHRQLQHLVEALVSLAPSRYNHLLQQIVKTAVDTLEGEMLERVERLVGLTKEAQ